MNNSVYLDNNATTPVDPAVARRVAESLDLYGNPSSMHTPGRQANSAITAARKEVAELIHARQSDEVIFTGCGSESNNAVLNVLFSPELRQSGRNRFITTVIEHPSIHELDDMLESRGIEVVRVPVDGSGLIDMEAYRKALNERTALVSVMAANNEIGTIQDVREAARLAREVGALVHTDAVQAAGKVSVDVQAWDVDYLSLSAHKIYAPKGIGALYIRRGVPFTPFLLGGHQEQGRRAGTYNTTGILAMGEAARLAREQLHEESRRIASLRDALQEGIRERIKRIRINGHPEQRVPGTLNISFMGAEGESILLYLDMEGISVSTGSACATGSLDPSYVLMELGIGAELAHGSIRFSLGRFTTEDDIAYVLEKLPPIIQRLRRMSTL